MQNRGIGLVGVLMVSGILLGLAAVLSRAAMVGSRGVQKANMAKQARYAAYSGLQVTMFELSKDNSISGDLGESGIAGSEARYHVTVHNNLSGLDTLEVDGSQIPPGSVQIISAGTAQDGTVQVNAGISGVLGQIEPTFENAAVGTNSINLSQSSLVDGWDSRLGPYAPYVHGVDSVSADIASNAYSDNSVVLDATSILDGNANMGPNSSDNAARMLGHFSGAAIDKSSEFRVARYIQPRGLTQRPDTTIRGAEDVTLQPGRYDILDVVGANIYNPATLTLPSGRYYIEELNLGNVEVNLALNSDNDPVELYVKGRRSSDKNIQNTRFTNVSFNSGGEAENLQVLFTSPVKNHRYRSSLTMTGSTANAVIAGEKLDMSATNSQVFGAVAARDLRARNSKFHYDNALADLKFQSNTGWSLDGVREDVSPDAVVGKIQYEDNCFIATAAFGSLLEPEVVTLRGFRDKWLMGNTAGRAFVRFYYQNSPPIANFISQRPALKSLVRLTLLPAVGMAKWPYLSFGLLLLIGIYLNLRIYRFLGKFRSREKPQSSEFPSGQV